MVTKTEIKFSLTIREAQSLLSWLRTSSERSNPYQFRGEKPLIDGMKKDCEYFKYELNNLLKDVK